MKRKAFSLIELIIALPLIALLFTFLLKNFTSSLLMNKKAEHLHQVALNEHYFQRRLQQILSRFEKEKQKMEYFQEKVLEFTFNNGMSKNPTTKGQLFSTFFLDPEDQTLKLELYKDSKKETLLRTEELLKNVEAVKFHYFFEEKNPAFQKRNPFHILHDAKHANPKKWIGLEVIATLKEEKNIRKKEETKTYFFTLQRSQSPVH